MNREELLECIKIISWRHNIPLSTVARLYSNELKHDDKIDALLLYMSIREEIGELL